MTGQVTVYWQPEAGAPFEPLCEVEGGPADEAGLLKEALRDAPPAAVGWIEKQGREWYLYLDGPEE